MSEEKNNNSASNGEEALKNGVKKAATAYAGPIGSKAVDIAADKIDNNKNNRFNNPNFTNSSNYNGKNESLNKTNELDDEGLNDSEEEKNNASFSKNNKSFNDESSNKSDDNEDISSVRKIKKIPSYIKILISLGGSTILTYLAIILGICLIVVATTAISEKLYLGLTGVENSVSGFFKNAANFFATVTGSTEEAAEQAYYNKLDSIYKEFKQTYNVDIDTTLITATLFYGRTMGDYADEDFLDEEKEIDDVDEEDIYQEESDKESIKFYRVAKRHIRTLAKYMLYQDTSFNKCVPNDEVDRVMIPGTPKEIADNWTTVSIFTQYSNKVWNTVNIFDYQPYEQIKFTNVDGVEVTIPDWCQFEDAHKKLEPYFRYDQKIYLEKKRAYEACREANINACKGSCADNDYNCYSECDKANFNACASEKAEFDRVARIFNENWTNEGLYDENGNFTCKTTSKWGRLATYDNELWFYNHMFDKDLKNKAIVPNFLEHYSSYIGEKIECSPDPAISYTYDVDTSEEGIYYYKLMTKTTSDWLFGKFGNKKSFIERYYAKLLPSNYDELSEEEQYESQKKIVDEIFLLYYTATADRKYNKFCYTPGDGNGTGVQNGGQTGIPNSSVQEFIEAIAPLAVQDMQSSGIPASVTIAQAIVESTHGTSGLTTGYNNYFGMTAYMKGCKLPPRRSDTKAHFVKSGTEDYSCSGNAFWNGDIVWMCNKSGKDCQWYRVYDGLSNSIHDHSRLLSNSDYQCQGLSPADTLYCIQHRKDGSRYADNDDYERTIINMINTYNLTQYDIGEWNGEPITDYGSTSLGTVCYEDPGTRDLAAGGGIENGEGTIGGLVNGERMSPPNGHPFWYTSNNLFYASSTSLIGQCTWYAHGRALEILTSNGMDLSTAKKYLAPMHGNAGLWFGQNKYFSSSTSVGSPKPGAIIVWSKPGQPGHVAIVESVKYDSSGKAVGVSLSEGGKSINGFRYTANRDINYIAAHGSYKFVGYVYLLG